ncbi:hypothetical protein FH968_23245 [Buttiauxella sp. B2]|uniref:hypothetical protein n=1 Tax=Buttiauxella sp. B2 TaxID=2587812 RepID=UPI001121B361|nr:hypothetical protein [Buttiauxella sp. B2]TNV09594.1 hypothetical protein FH968_23245 [Buttiauxella sp. B2]
MKHRWSKPRTKVSEAVIALCYTLAVYGIYFQSRFTTESATRMKDNMGESLGLLYAVYAHILSPIITIAAGYTAVYLTFCFIRQVTEKGGK